MKISIIVDSLQTVIEGCCYELFSSYQCEVTLVPYIEIDYIIDQFENDYSAVIDLGSDDIELFSVLQMPLSVLAMTYPVPDVLTLTDEALEDWISELSTQLIGRLKNQLLKHDCNLKLGLPETYYEKDIDDILPENSGRFTLYFDIDGEICGCTLSVEIFNENMEFSVEENNMDLMDEGELELF